MLLSGQLSKIKDPMRGLRMLDFLLGTCPNYEWFHCGATEILGFSGMGIKTLRGKGKRSCKNSLCQKGTVGRSLRGRRNGEGWAVGDGRGPRGGGSGVQVASRDGGEHGGVKGWGEWVFGIFFWKEEGCRGRGRGMVLQAPLQVVGK